VRGGQRPAGRQRRGRRISAHGSGLRSDGQVEGAADRVGQQGQLLQGLGRSIFEHGWQHSIDNLA
jgi:hypothetical protein